MEKQFFEDVNLQAGFGRACISPQGIVHLAGGDASKRRTDTLLDDLFITCVALRDQTQTVLVYTMDVVAAEDSFTAPARAAVSAATGVPQENILMNATHVHSAVSIRSEWDGVEAYRALFNDAAAKAGVEAIEDLAAAEVSYGDTQTENLAFVRHYALDNGTFAGPNFGSFKSGKIIGHAEKADTLCQVVRFTREGAKDIIMMNFPAHATLKGRTIDLWISADFPGTTRKFVEENTGALVAYFIAGGGNQVPSTRIPEERIVPEQDHEAYGQCLGRYVLETLPKLTKVAAAPLKLTTKTYIGISNKEDLDKLPNAEEVVEAGRTYGNVSAEAVAVARANGFSSYFAATAVITRSRLPETIPMDLRTLTIGNLGFVFAPYEMFGTSAVTLREKSPMDATFIVTCSQGAKGYMPDKRGFELGCYESCVTRFARGTAEKLVDEFVAMLSE